ncbi:hypothetical protein ASPFODRAFT_61858 [Aspergillus luchuensis CBS 106.47]|uniref:Uncharacterized protein n=1 Tax=Aspergillus luchuensis (strain CBS 106.47) TaxID=1137211 RepID=A0A1M3TEM3_ASPLC|nr:hypothetical protein ASPFODRAFT_61858 [Aspergillus luchuensis CBS 106.47]
MTRWPAQTHQTCPIGGKRHFPVGWTTGGEIWDGNNLNGHPVPTCQAAEMQTRIALNAPTNHQNANILKAAREQRLAETESALYGALMTLSSMGPTTTLLQATTKTDSLQKSKAARMDEWSRLPLRGWPDIYHWKASMCDQFTLNQSQEVPLVDHSTASHAISASPAATTIHSHSPQGELETPGPASFAWHPGGNVNMGSPYNAYLRPPGMVSSPTYLRDPAPGPAETIVNPFPDFSTATVTGNSGKEDEHSTMADELSKSKPSIYF